MKKLLAVFTFMTLTSATYAQKQILGKWLTQDKDAIIEIYKKDNKYYGKVVKLIPEQYENGSQIIDEHNPNKSLRNRPVLGINSIIGFSWDSEKQILVDGKVYDPKKGKFYTGKIWEEEGKLKMRGYVGIFYQTETWTRAK